jgi:translocation and assembly module TamA
MIRAAAALLACALLAGCSSLKLFGFGREDTAVEKPVPMRTAYHVEVVAPDDLRALLLNYLDLARFSVAPETETMTPAELTRLAAAAPVQVRSLLETEGYFNAQVKIDPGTHADGLPLLRLQIDPGPRVMIESLALTTTGALKEAPDAAARLDAMKSDFALQPGQPFRQPLWTAAKNQTLARLRAEGYPAAAWGRTAAQIDAINHRATLDLEADSGPLFRLGALRIEGLQRYDEESTRNLSTFRPGEPYTEKLLLDYQERLQKIGLFEGASVEVDPDPATAAAAPVRVRLKELPLQQATLGVGISANTGPRVTLEHTHRQPFGWKWVAKNKFELGRDLDKWEGSLTSYPLDGLYRNLVAGASERLKSDDEVLTSTFVRLGRTQDTPRIERLYFGEVLHTTLDNNITGRTSADAYSGNYHWIYRDLDSVLLPTQGITLSAQAALGYARSSTADNGVFTRLYGRFTWYQPLGASWYATARVEAAQVFARESVGLPDTLLFRAGGDESVRGYAYRTLGPTAFANPDGTGAATVSSGRMLFTASAEIARPISPRRPEFWWAAFVDAGNAADHWNELHPALGYGVGLRWRSPVGPLRLDLAYGEEVHKARVHLSVGIAF